MTETIESLENKVKTLGICVILLVFALLYVSYSGAMVNKKCNEFWFSQFEKFVDEGFCGFNNNVLDNSTSYLYGLNITVE